MVDANMADLESPPMGYRKATPQEMKDRAKSLAYADRLVNLERSIAALTEELESAQVLDGHFKKPCEGKEFLDHTSGLCVKE